MSGLTSYRIHPEITCNATAFTSIHRYRGWRITGLVLLGHDELSVVMERDLAVNFPTSEKCD